MKGSMVSVGENGPLIPNWGILLNMGFEQKSRRIFVLLREISNKLESETALLLAPHDGKSGVWTIPEGWVYSESNFPVNFAVSGREHIIGRALSEESIVIDTKLGDVIPEPLAKSGVESAIATAIGYPEREGLLFVCNSKKEFGRPPFQVHYTNRSRELAMVIARVISLNGVGNFIRQLSTRKWTVVETGTWMQEKKELA